MAPRPARIRALDSGPSHSCHFSGVTSSPGGFMRVVGRALAVGACLLSGTLAAPAQADDPAPLPAPAGLRITGRTPTTVSFAWKPVRTAPAYRLTVSRDPSMSGSIARSFPAAFGTVYRLQPATRYYVNVRVLSP